MIEPLVAKLRLSRLSPRERETLRLLVLLVDQKSIADQMSISVATVNDHVRAIYGKLGVNRAVHAAVIAIKGELL